MPSESRSSAIIFIFERPSARTLPDPASGNTRISLTSPATPGSVIVTVSAISPAAAKTVICSPTASVGYVNVVVAVPSLVATGLLICPTSDSREKLTSVPSSTGFRFSSETIADTESVDKTSPASRLLNCASTSI